MRATWLLSGFPLFLLLLLGILQYTLWCSAGGLLKVHRLNQAIGQLVQQNTRLNDRNTILKADIHSLKTGTGAIEERARNELGMIKKGEVFYQIVS